MPVSPFPIAVIVLSMGPRPSLVGAVRSVLDQDEQVELVIVHSGPGSAERLLAEAGISARVVTSVAPLLPGGARNVGIASTTAPLVSFLADDCEAAAGWLTLRREAHDAGHLAVASALVSHRPHRPVALAAHLSLFVNRMPRARPEHALKYGVSYRRDVVERLGAFRDDLRGGEDTEYNSRLGPQDIHWDPRIRTVHRGAESLGEFLRDQAQRGRRMIDTRIGLADGLESRVVADSLERTCTTLRRSVRVVERRQLPALLAATPVIVAGGIAYAWGASRQRRRS